MPLSIDGTTTPATSLTNAAIAAQVVSVLKPIATHLRDIGDLLAADIVLGYAEEWQAHQQECLRDSV